MPYGWVNPDIFLEFNGVNVYHTYKSDEYTNQCENWYTTDKNTTENNDECIFDVRDLPRPDKDNKCESHFHIIRNAIDKKILKLPEGVEYE